MYTYIRHDTQAVFEDLSLKHKVIQQIEVSFVVRQPCGWDG